MDEIGKLLVYTIPGLFTGAAYAIAASGLVLTYTTTRVFNIAHGAFGMVLSFIFWDFSVKNGMNTWLALFLVLFVVAPLMGLVVQRFVTKGLASAPVSVSLVVTVAMFVGLVGFAQSFWPEDAVLEAGVNRLVPAFWEGFASGDGTPGWQINFWGDNQTTVTGLYLITMLSSIAVAIGLYLLLNKTRIGTAMRASVDNPDLLRLFGGKPDQAAALAWMIGMSLAALAGILLVNQVGLNYFGLTLLVINAYAAAMVGRLKSLPMTFLGAMLIGIFESLAIGYINADSPFGLNTLRPALVPLFLFAVIVLMPQAQLRIGQVKGIKAVPVPSNLRMGVAGAAVLLFAAMISVRSDEVTLLRVGIAATYAIVMLSLVLLTGYGGHVSLAQLSFAGVGALTYAKGGIDIWFIKLDVPPNLWGLFLSALMAAIVGGLVALPVLRLTGLYLALSTLAFGVLMDKIVFQHEKAFGFGGALSAERLSIFGKQISSTGGYVFVMVCFLVGIGMLVLVVRKGVIGRMLIAMRDSPAACGTLGLDMRWFRVGLFAASAGIAGLAGALLAGLRGTIGAADFQFFNSLPLLLLAVVFGVTSVTGATLGGIGLMLLGVWSSEEIGGVPLGGVLFMIIGVGAVLSSRDPNGLVSYAFKLGRYVEKQVKLSIGANLPQLPAMAGAGRGAGDPDDAGLDLVDDGHGHDHDHGHGHGHDQPHDGDVDLTKGGDPRAAARG